MEIAHAVKHNKRLVPIVYRDVEIETVPQSLAALQWIFFREGDDFDTAFRVLVQAIETDLDWVRAHTRLLVRALEWDRKGRGSSFLLRGEDLREAEQWLTQDTEKEPRPTPRHFEYVSTSRRVTTNRLRLTLGAVTFGFVIASKYISC